MTSFLHRLQDVIDQMEYRGDLTPAGERWVEEFKYVRVVSERMTPTSLRSLNNRLSLACHNHHRYATLRKIINGQRGYFSLTCFKECHLESQAVLQEMIHDWQKESSQAAMNSIHEFMDGLVQHFQGLARPAQ